ncbi:hypothetical protein BKA62DRAFT_719723 [Auriculariales sp. MPI-PUGE-AT-0066]|nr:hypothetical protein BKA62DRAFT_719723 [Auriculariales sp. MPI-PUGE-AT-0066]
MLSAFESDLEQAIARKLGRALDESLKHCGSKTRIHLDVHVELIRIIELVQKKALHAVQRAVSNAGRRVNAYAPVNRLPGDVLVEIFSNLGSMFMIQVARVCPRLDLYPGGRFSRDAELILGRTKNIPLDIKLDMCGIPWDEDDCMDEDREHEAREHFTQATKLLRYRMPRLRSLHLTYHHVTYSYLPTGDMDSVICEPLFAAWRICSGTGSHSDQRPRACRTFVILSESDISLMMSCRNCPSIKRISLISYANNHYVHCDAGDLLRGVQCLKLDGPRAESRSRVSMNQPASHMLSTIEVSSWQDGIDVSDAPGNHHLATCTGQYTVSEEPRNSPSSNHHPDRTTGERWRKFIFACNNQGLRRRVNSQSMKTFSPEMSHKIACPALRVLELTFAAQDLEPCHAPPPVPWRATKAFAFSPNLETDHAPFPKEVFGELD